MPKHKHFQLQSREELFIKRAPNSSITTRKYAPVNADQMMRDIRESQDDRFDESISKISKNGNQFSDMNYSNRNNGATLLHNKNMEGRNPYAIRNVRPPEFRLEDLEPWSRRRHKDISVTTNPGIQKGYNTTTHGEYIDNTDIRRTIDKSKINYLSMKPNSSFTVGKVVPIFVRNSIADKISNHNVNAVKTSKSNTQITNPTIMNAASRIFKKIAVTALPSMNKEIVHNTNINTNNHLKDNLLLQNITSGFNITVYNPRTNTFNDLKAANTKEALNIAVNASKSMPIQILTKNGENIRLKDYTTQVVDSGKRLIIHLPTNNKEYNFERNIPLYSSSTNVSGQAQIEHYTPEQFVSDRVKPTNVYSNVNSNAYKPRENKNNEFTTDKVASYGSFNNLGNMPSYSDHNLPELSSEKLRLTRATNDLTDRYSRR